MRTVRIKEEGAGYYHIISRVVDRRMALDDDEKERFRRTMRATEGFSGCQVLTFAVLDNHWHILLYVPDSQEPTDAEFARRLACLYDRQFVKGIADALNEHREAGEDAAAEALKAPYLYRMCELSEFVKTLKQRFTQAHNRRHGRKGTLWEERFKSVLIGGEEGSLSATAAYIDLNAIRAGIVRDPKDYRFCGYGEAVGGSANARKGIGSVMLSLGQSPDWEQAAGQYRKLLYVTGESAARDEDGCLLKPGFSAEQVNAVVEAKGKLPLNVLLRCRVRYFTDGAVLGSRAFADDVFGRHRTFFSLKRASGARPMKGGDWGDLCTARRLRREVIAPLVI